jgi:hypothetical protein
LLLLWERVRLFHEINSKSLFMKNKYKNALVTRF